MKVFWDLRPHGHLGRSGPVRLTARYHKRHTIRGRLVTCKGKPIIGAKITLYNYVRGNVRAAREDARARVRARSRSPRSTATARPGGRRGAPASATAPVDAGRGCAAPARRHCPGWGPLSPLRAAAAVRPPCPAGGRRVRRRRGRPWRSTARRGRWCTR